MRADIAEIRAAQRQETAVGVERQFGRHRQIAAHIIGDECFVRSAGPFHRPADALREPQTTMANSGKKLLRVPKLPPISWATTRTESNGTPKICDSSRFCRTMPPEPA